MSERTKQQLERRIRRKNIINYTSRHFHINLLLCLWKYLNWFHRGELICSMTNEGEAATCNIRKMHAISTMEWKMCVHCSLRFLIARWRTHYLQTSLKVERNVQWKWDNRKLWHFSSLSLIYQKTINFPSPLHIFCLVFLLVVIANGWKL